MEKYHYIAITISIFSLFVSFYTYKKTYKLNLDTRNLNIRKAISEQFDEYTTLLHSEYLKLKDDLSMVSSILCITNTSIGNVLDKYDSRIRNLSKQYQRSLQHIYVDLYREITNSFEHELSWQSTENLYWRLEMFMHLDYRSDFKKNHSQWRNIFSRKENDNLYQEHRLMESKTFISSFIELNDSIETSNYLNLYNDFVDACKELKDVLEEIKPKCEKSYDILESGIIKNSLQEFKLWEYPPLSTRYTL